MDENLTFLEKFIDNDTLNTYNSLKNCENLEIKNQHLKEQYEQLLFSTQLLKSIKNELNNLKHENIILKFNYLIYHIRKLLKMADINNDLDKTLIIFKNILKQEQECLIILNNKLLANLDNTNIPKISKISKIYLYFIALSTIKNDIKNYYIEQLTIDDSYSKGFYVQFNNQKNIDQMQETFDQVKIYINNLNNN